MPAGSEQNAQPRPQLWTDYRGFHERLIADCQRLGAAVPDDRVIAAEYVQRRVELHRLVCWDRGLPTVAVDEQVAELRQRWLGEIAAFHQGRGRDR